MTSTLIKYQILMKISKISKDKTTAFADITYDVSQTSLKDGSRDNVKII